MIIKQIVIPRKTSRAWNRFPADKLAADKLVADKLDMNSSLGLKFSLVWSLNDTKPNIGNFPDFAFPLVIIFRKTKPKKKPLNLAKKLTYAKKMVAVDPGPAGHSIPGRTKPGKPLL
jgi:hypothetical protein